MNNADLAQPTPPSLALHQARACKEAASLLAVTAAGGKAGELLTHAGIVLKAIETRPPEELRELRAKLAPIEDGLLALDAGLDAERFEAMIEGAGEQSLLGYGRLLASRPLRPGSRADRFEVIARRLLTTRRADGRFRVRPAHETEPLVEALVQGAPGPRDAAAREKVLAEVAALRERVLQTEHVEQLGELYAQVRTGCVSAAAFLVDPEILLTAVNLEVQLHNKIEGWVTRLELHQRARPSFLSGNPREYIEAAIAAQERKIAQALRPQLPPDDLARMARGEQGPSAPRAPAAAARRHARAQAPGSTPPPKPRRQEKDGRPPLRKLFDYVSGLPRGTAVVAMVVINILSLSIILYAITAL